MNPKKKIKRSELYRMAWEEALSKLAPKLGLSDAGLHKICKRHNIPLPPQGYWARSPERGPPKRIPLPQPDKDWEWTLKVGLRSGLIHRRLADHGDMLSALGARKTAGMVLPLHQARWRPSAFNREPSWQLY